MLGERVFQDLPLKLQFGKHGQLLQAQWLPLRCTCTASLFPACKVRQKSVCHFELATSDEG